MRCSRDSYATDRMTPAGLELGLGRLADPVVVQAKAGQGVLLEVLAVAAAEVVVEEEEDHGAGDRRMGIASGTVGTVGDLGHDGLGRGTKVHAPTKRTLGVPRKDGAQRLERRRLGWDQR